MGWVVYGAAVMVVLLDQTTKSLAVRFLSPAANRNWWFAPAAPTAPVLLALWSSALACTALAIATNPALSSNELATVALVAAMAGATSNLGDRLGRHAVIDFIAVGRWPPFNLADVAIVAGVAVAVGSVV